MTSATEPARRHARLTVLAVVAAFALPIFLAWLLASGVVPWLPRGRVNYGALVNPPLDLSTSRIVDERDGTVSLARRYGEWTLAVILPGECEEPCRTALDHMQRIHRALQKDMDRVQLAALVDREVSTSGLPRAAMQPGTRLYRIDTRELIDRLRAAHLLDQGESGYHRMTIVDYAARAMMVYPVDADMGGVTKDLKRLLRASRTD